MSRPQPHPATAPGHDKRSPSTVFPGRLLASQSIPQHRSSPDTTLRSGASRHRPVRSNDPSLRPVEARPHHPRSNRTSIACAVLSASDRRADDQHRSASVHLVPDQCLGGNPFGTERRDTPGTHRREKPQSCSSFHAVVLGIRSITPNQLRPSPNFSRETVSSMREPLGG